MAFISCQIRSDVLDQRVDVDVFLPADSPKEKGREAAGILYLLHGQGGSNTDWQQYTAIARYATANRLAVIYPSCPQSFYVDMAYGGAFYTYLTEELPALLHTMFRLPVGREKTFVAGLSMGGYGAALLGLSRPDLFGAFAEFSGAVDVEALTAFKEDPYVRSIAVPAFGEKMEVPEKYDLFKLAETAAALPEEQRPRIFMACGLQDDFMGLYQQNVKFRDHIASLPLPMKWMEWNGIHEYNFGTALSYTLSPISWAMIMTSANYRTGDKRSWQNDPWPLGCGPKNWRMFAGNSICWAKGRSSVLFWKGAPFPIWSFTALPVWERPPWPPYWLNAAICACSNSTGPAPLPAISAA